MELYNIVFRTNDDTYDGVSIHPMSNIKECSFNERFFAQSSAKAVDAFIENVEYLYGIAVFIDNRIVTSRKNANGEYIFFSNIVANISEL